VRFPIDPKLHRGRNSAEVSAILLHRVGADPPISFWWPLLLAVGCCAIAMGGYRVGTQLSKKMTPNIPYHFLTAASVWHDVSQKMDTNKKILVAAGLGEN